MDFDVVIIGAGVVGLAIASELSAKGMNILVPEAYSSFGHETSSRNSEVIHGGMYYPTDSLKAKLCIEGNRMIYEWCLKYNVPHLKIGKYIIAVTKDDISNLISLFELGIKNKVPDLKLISKEEFSEIEPNIKAEYALFSPTTGILDSHSFMQSLETNSLKNGVTFAYNHKVVKIEKYITGYLITVEFGNQTFSFSCNSIINSAGLFSDKIAEMAGINIDESNYRLSFAKGHYFRLVPSKSNIAKHLIYPAPQTNWTGIGIHITQDLSGSIKFGPDISYLKENKLDYSFESGIKDKFHESIRRYAPTVTSEDLSPDQVGIRPKLQKPGENFRDFVIQEESKRGLPNFWNLIGIESPGLTASLAIGKYIASHF